MPDEQSLIAEALRLKAEKPSWGYIRIGQAIGLHKDKVRRAIEHAERKGSNLPAITAPSTNIPALSFYDTARQALGRAKTLSEVKEIADKSAAMREYARRAHDFSLQRDAEEMQVLAKTEWGRLALMTGLNKGTRGQLRGDVPVGGRAPEPPTDTRPTLEEMGVDKKFSADAQKLAKLSDRAIEARLAERRRAWEENGHRMTMDILKPLPSRSMTRVESADSLDPFFTPPWATRALMEHVFPQLGYFGGGGKWKVWEPACGEGHILGVLEEYFRQADGSDIHDYNGNAVIDFLGAHNLESMSPYQWIITNPPFRGDMAERFVLRAVELATVGVAMFVALQFVETVGRYNHIFKDRPPTLISFFAERVNCCKGRWDPDGSTDAAYVWLVWVKDRLPMSPFWIPPGCRESLTKPDDRARFAAWSLPEAAE